MKSIARPHRAGAHTIRIAVAWSVASLLMACGEESEAPAPTPSAEPPAAARAEPPAPPRAPARPSASEDGIEAMIGGDVSVPDGFPADIALYPGAIPTASISSKGEGTLVTFDSNDAPQMVFDFYEEKLIDAGWSIESSASMGDQWMLSAFKDDRNAYISIAAAPAGSQIGVAVAMAP